MPEIQFYRNTRRDSSWAACETIEYNRNRYIKPDFGIKPISNKLFGTILKIVLNHLFDKQQIKQIVNTIYYYIYISILNSLHDFICLHYMLTDYRLRINYS